MTGHDKEIKIYGYNNYIDVDDKILLDTYVKLGEILMVKRLMTIVVIQYHYQVMALLLLLEPIATMVMYF